MFYVYGVTMQDCIKQARRRLLASSSQSKSQSEFDEAATAMAKELFIKAKPKCISGELSCPERVAEFVSLALKDESVRAIKPMKKVQNIDGAGNPILTKKTGKPTFKIVPMSLDGIKGE